MSVFFSVLLYDTLWTKQVLNNHSEQRNILHCIYLHSADFLCAVPVPRCGIPSVGEKILIVGGEV